MKKSIYNNSQKELAKYFARELRKNSTIAENIFWEAVRNRRFLNKKFYRQYVIFYDNQGKERFFIADFYCPEEKIIVELDGGIHNKQKNYDKIRSEFIESKSIRVIRFKNREIENSLSEVFDRLKRFLGYVG